MRPRARTLVVAAALGAACVPAAGAQAARAPSLEQLVVFRSGKALEQRVSTAGLRVRVGGRRCAVPGRTPLAALIRLRPARIRLRDFGSCSRRASDAAGLYVAAIGGEGERGSGGWVYKVGRKAGTAGAADPSGPFGRGRLRKGRRVLWFYCLEANRCQRTLELKVRTEPGAVRVTVTGYDDHGKGVRIPAATVHGGETTAVTGRDGGARLSLPAGGHRLYAEKDGLIRSFSKRVAVP
jgi:hypothetical protein